MSAIRLINAGIPAIENAQRLIKGNKLPKQISFKDLLDHGMYDTKTQEICLTIKAVTLKFPLEQLTQ